MRSVLRLPALQALLIQILACVLALSAASLLSATTPVQPSLLVAAIVQGCVAAGLSRWWRMPRWWFWIHLLFAPTLLLLLAAQLPPWIYLLLFVLTLGLYWQTFRTRVPYYPSTRAVRDVVAGLLPQHSIRFIDVGAGFGGLALDLAARRPDAHVAGIELAPIPWICSVLRARAVQSRARFIRGDYDDLDLGAYDVVFAYLSPAAMPALWHKARNEMRPGSLLLSYEFDIPGTQPDLSMSVGTGQARMYGWRFQA